MKRFSRKIIKTIGIILIVFLVLLVLSVLSQMLHDYIENCKSENNLFISYGKEEKDIGDEDYYSSVEEAVKAAENEMVPYLKKQNIYKCTIDNIIFSMENAQYAFLYYVSQKDSDQVCFSAVKFKIKNVNGVKMYAYYRHISKAYSKHELDEISGEDFLKQDLKYADLAQYLSLSEESNRFLYGNIKADSLKNEENINNLCVEGQKPDEIIQYNCLGERFYFWYYTDLKTRKIAAQLSATFE